MSSSQPAFIKELKRIIGAKHVLTGDARTRRHRHGYRFGRGRALAVVKPGSLLELYRVIKACVEANTIVIMQAANTGLTGGSTPSDEGYDRDVVIVNTLRMDKIHIIKGGDQVICHPGATLYRLEKELKPLGREPHSVIGSSCIGASAIGGIANNSGGALVRRGPAYTQLALYMRVNEDGHVELVNHLGVSLGDDPEEILTRLDKGEFTEADIAQSGAVASDPEYQTHVRDVDANTPSRFNADPRRFYEASGSAGKLAILAVRLDTFVKEEKEQVFYIGTNDPNALTELRRHMLQRFDSLPVAGEYIHKDAFNLAEIYGKDIFLTIDRCGTDAMPHFFGLKSRFDAVAERTLFPHLSDHFLQSASRLFPSHLPPRIKEYGARFEHHLLLKMAGPGIAEARDFLERFFEDPARGAYFECDAEEAKKAFLHRFAVASAAIRYRAVHAGEVEDLLSLDIALRRNDRDWVETLPPELDAQIALKIYYGHFFCHVFHQDYIVKKGHNPLEIEHAMWRLLEQRGAQFPAEHNVGHLYAAKPPLRQFYKELDPCNCLNPGIGHTSRNFKWK